MREWMSRLIGKSLSGIGYMLCAVVVVGLFLLFPIILRLLWNDMAPVFGIDIQLSLWQTIKAMWLVAFISGIVKGFNFKYNGKKK